MQYYMWHCTKYKWEWDNDNDTVINFKLSFHPCTCEPKIHQLGAAQTVFSRDLFGSDGFVSIILMKQSMKQIKLISIWQTDVDAT